MSKGAKEIEHYLGQISYGISPTKNKKLLPITNQTAQLLFDAGKLKEFMKKQNQPVSSATSSDDYVMGDSFSKASQSMSAQVSVSGDYSVPSFAVSGSLEAEFSFQHDRQEISSFCQRRKAMTFATITMPSVNQATMWSLMDASAREALDGIRSKEDADVKIIRGYGPFYVSTASFGAVLTLSSYSCASQSASTTDLKASIEASFKTLSTSGKAKIDAAFQEAIEAKESRTSVSMYAVGGTSHLAFAADPTDWQISAETNPQIVRYNLLPTYTLLPTSSQAYQHAKQSYEAYAKENEALLTQFDLAVQATKKKLSDKEKSEKLKFNVNREHAKNRLQSHADWLQTEAATADSWVNTWWAVTDSTRNRNWRDQASNMRQAVEAQIAILKNPSETQTWRDFVEDLRRSAKDNRAWAITVKAWGPGGHDGAEAGKVIDATAGCLEEVVRFF